LFNKYIYVKLGICHTIDDNIRMFCYVMSESNPQINNDSENTQEVERGRER